MALALAFLAGLLTILSPCVAPLAPIVIAGSRAKGFAAPLALAAGLAASFGIIGGALAAAGVEAGEFAPLRYFAAVLLALAGAAMLWPALQTRLEVALLPLGRAANALDRRLPAGLIGQFLLGAVLALAWAPCAGPTLGAAFALAASGGSRLFATVAMAAFAIGAASALLVVGYFIGRLGKGMRAGAAWGRIAFGCVTLAVGVAILTGLDLQAEAWGVAAMPNWLATFATQL